jgi:hypothetical protein
MARRATRHARQKYPACAAGPLHPRFFVFFSFFCPGLLAALNRCDQQGRDGNAKVIRAKDAAAATGAAATEDPIPRACAANRHCPLGPAPAPVSGHSPPECGMEGTKRQCRERVCI